MPIAMPIVSVGARRYYRVLAAIFVALAILDLFTLDLHQQRNVAQLLFHISIPFFFIAFQLDPSNRFRTSFVLLASITMVGNAIFMFSSIFG